MHSLTWAKENPSHSKLLFKCGVIAFVCEGVLLTSIAWQEHWLAHPQKTTGLDDSRFIEAQVFEVPPEAHLVDQKKTISLPRKPEATLSKVPAQGTSKGSPVSAAEEENQTEAGPKMAPTHGPVAVYAPPPVIPNYLRNREFKTHVVIDFFVTSQGVATPRLVTPSGNEELDAIALETVKKWLFRPAEENHKAVDAKVRLRILFAVE